LAAGRVERRFGGGRVVEPMRLIIGDRATMVWGKETLNVSEIAIEAAKGWFREHLPRIDPDRHLLCQVELRPTSEELAGIFSTKKTIMLGANDTSAAVGYAPLTETERLVLDAERHLNAPAFKKRFPETGEDVKVMGIRTGRRLSLTVAVPLVDQFIKNESDYFKRKKAIHAALAAHLSGQLDSLLEISIRLNTLDRRGAGPAGMYLSVLGTSAEDADSGEVGRGNQVNGLIPLLRPRCSEAAAGKNPVSHVGKIYNILVFLLAGRIHAEIPGIREVTVWLCSQIGEPVDRPRIILAQLYLQPNVTLEDVAAPIRQLINQELTRMPSFLEELVAGRYPVC
ncbi:MAG TPA: methionine adenosyltransferase, partial [Candidatus Manganitrophaceae bacterium]